MQQLGIFMRLTITWEIIVLGFIMVFIFIHTVMLNNLISFVCFTIYKYKMKCRFDSEIKILCQKKNILQKLKYNIYLQNDILKYVR